MMSEALEQRVCETPSATPRSRQSRLALKLFGQNQLGHWMWRPKEHAAVREHRNVVQVRARPTISTLRSSRSEPGNQTENPRASGAYSLLSFGRRHIRATCRVLDYDVLLGAIQVSEPIVSCREFVETLIVCEFWVVSLSYWASMRVLIRWLRAC